MKAIHFLTSFICACFMFMALESARADIVHYVRVTQQTVLRDRTIVPAGGEIAVKYDTGDAWLPYMQLSFPRIAKSAGTLIEAVVFSPPIDGIVKKLIPIYQRTDFPNSLATRVIPNSRGDVLSEGDSVKITGRQGDFYFVTTQTHRDALVPVSTINAQRSALASGQVVAVPSVPSSTSEAVAPQNPPRTGRLFGRLKVPYTLGGKPLPAGSYIQIQYDAGEFWIIGGSFSQDPPRISKAAVDLINRTEFLTPLSGRIKTATTVFKLMPDTVRIPESLEQSESFANLNPSIRVGDEIYITAQEGNDYIAELPQQGTIRKSGRVPVNAVEIIAGNTSSGVPIIAPPQPPRMPTPPKLGDTIDLYGIWFALISVGTGIAGWFARRAANASTLKPGEADYGVPHTRFINTESGFRVTFMRSSEIFYRITQANMNNKQQNIFAVILLFIISIIFIFIIIMWAGIESFFKTVIVVDHESVTINGKRMPRGDFGGFSIDHTISGDTGEVAVLGYSFGRRTFPFGGVWKDRQAQEVASALNKHLRYAKSAAAQQRATPEKLRETRPIDF